MGIIYDHEAEHSISDVPKHSSNGGLKPPVIFPSPLSLVKSSPLNSENPKTSLDGQIFRKFTQGGRAEPWEVGCKSYKRDTPWRGPGVEPGTRGVKGVGMSRGRAKIYIHQ